MKNKLAIMKKFDYSKHPQEVVKFYKLLYITYGKQFPLYGMMPNNIWATMRNIGYVGSDFHVRNNIASLLDKSTTAYIFTDEFIEFLGEIC